MILTKQTVIKWKSVEDILNPNIVKERKEKLQEMILAEKTDGIATKVNDLTRSIRFTNQAAAQEWIDFVKASTQSHGIELVSTEILDV